jgi:hypothetical protein
MKTLNLIAILLLLLCALIAEAQPSSITFTYDAAGNRIQREIWFKIKSSETNVDSTIAIRPFTDYLDEMKITIYPNPTQGRLSVEISNMPKDKTGEITLHNMEGKRLQYLRSLETVNRFDLSTYPMGVYIFRITVGKKVSEWKIIKQ